MAPLRERSSDIVLLVKHFVNAETNANIIVSENVLAELKHYKWMGNVRELESTIKYMLAVRTNNELTLNDLPDRNFFEEDTIKTTEDPYKRNKTEKLNNEIEVILKSIGNFQNNNIVAGRVKIAEKMNELGYEVTQSEIRTKLQELEKEGYIKRIAGKKGVILTQLGINYSRNIL